ncbi:MAG: rhodanese-like domain-containing protein [Bacteroidales bacterium]|nr:rhodanese-like domain-containing protein [Bacteroidales bacterium]
MKHIKLFKGILLVFIAFAFSSCTETVLDSKQATINLPQITDQSDAIVNFFNNSGDYINGENSPYLISVDEVKENIDKYLLIDTRYHEDYVLGHIDGAINVDREMIIDFLKSINIYQYEKIIIIDNTGQGSAYVTSVLRAIGYGSAYGMKFGMSSWSKVFADRWQKNVGDKYANYITKEEFAKAPKGKIPVFKTKGQSISEILELRAKEVINYNFSVTVDNLIKNIDDYYIITYWSKANYDIAHLKEAVWYQPKKSLNINVDLSTIPTDKKVVIYCNTGHRGSSVAAYLRILGYDAYNLRFGVNSFIHKEALVNGWHAYIANEKVNDFDIVIGENPSKEKKAKANTIINPDLNFKHREVIQPDPSEVCD